jgi:Uri superfamily endonuclease
MTTKHIERTAHLRWLGPIEDFKVSPVAQREQRPHWVDYLIANMDLEQLGIITVNIRKPSGEAYIIDGAHRILALVKGFGWGDQQVQCQVYEGLSEAEEADVFLKLNKQLSVNAFDNYRVAVTAGRDVECSIDQIVRQAGLRVARGKADDAVACVGTLQRIYTQHGPSALAKTLRIVRDAYGQPGYQAIILGGIGQLVARYNGDLNTERLVTKLATATAGVSGLRGRAAVAQKQFGGTREACVAAAAVDIYNTPGGKGKRVPSWWKAADQ